MPFMKKSAAFDEVKKALDACGFELLDGDLTSQQLTGLKKEHGVERLLHVAMYVINTDVRLEWEARTVGLELKKHRRNKMEEVRFERKIRHQLLARSGQSGAAA